MAKALAFIAGGLLEGVGKGLVERARETGKQKRARALAELAIERDEKQLEGRRGLLDASNTSALERLGLNITSRENVAAAATTSREMLASQATVSRETIASKATASREGIAAEANISREKVARIAAGKPSDSSAAEKRAFDSLVEIHTVADENGLEATDWNAVAEGLNEKGFGNLAKSARSRGKGIADLELRKRAEQFADQMVDEQADPFHTDARDFKEDGGSRTRFRARMVREYIAKNGGGAPATPATEPATTEPPAAKPEALTTVPYVGDAQPPDFPDARRADDGFWYVKRGDKTLRVQQPKAKRRRVR